MNEQEMKETLEQQMRLLSKSSEKANASELTALTNAMVQIAGFLQAIESYKALNTSIHHD